MKIEASRTAISHRALLDPPPAFITDHIPHRLGLRFERGLVKIGLCPRRSFLGSRYFSIGKSAQSLSKLTIGSKSCSRARKIFKGFLPLFPYFIFSLLCTTFERHKWTSSKVTYLWLVHSSCTIYVLGDSKSNLEQK